MGTIHLIERKAPHRFYILEEGRPHEKDGEGAVQIRGTEDIMQAESISDLLHQIQDKGDTRFFAGTDFIDSKKRTRKGTYPLHCDLHILPGFVRDVCDIRIEHLYEAEWTVRYISDLWVKVSEDQMLKVKGFTKKARAAAERYITDQKLMYEKAVSANS